MLKATNTFVMPILWRIRQLGDAWSKRRRGKALHSQPRFEHLEDRHLPSIQATSLALPGGAAVGRIAAGIQGSIWTYENTRSGGVAYEIMPISNAIRSFPLSGSLNDIQMGPDQNLWLTGSQGPDAMLWRITPGGSISSVRVNSTPVSICGGPDGNLWFTESQADKIGRIAPDFTGYTEFNLASGSRPLDILTG